MTTSTTFTDYYGPPQITPESDLLWSDLLNWNNGLPTDGDTVAIDGYGYDDIAGLNLATLDGDPGPEFPTFVTASSLTIGTYAQEDTLLSADALGAGAPVTVTIGSVTSSSAHLVATGAGATLIDNSSADTGNLYQTYDGGFLELAAAPSINSSFDYGNTQGTIALAGAVPGVNAEAIDPSAGATLELPGTEVLGVTFGPNSVDVTTTAGNFDFTNFNASGFGYTAGFDSTTGLAEVTFTVCYVTGTRIQTDRGEVAVEKLEVGDRLVTASGAHRPVRWLGNRRVDCARHPEPSAVWPVRIQAGAFASGVPARDLWVSPGHSIFIEGVLIEAEKLVNGATIVQVPLASVEYWHVELDSHDVILAEGLAAESYLDTGNRAGFFNNGGAYLEAHPDFKPKHWAETCVPLVFEGAAVQKARGDLRERAIALGYELTEDPDVHVMIDGKRVDPVRLGAERVAFLLPQGGSNIELRSRTFIPAHIIPNSTDNRSLGLCVFRLQIDCEVALDDEAQIRSGWNGLERYENGRQQRWSRDRMPLPAGTRLVVIDMHRQNPVYWRESAVAAVAGANRGLRVAARV